ncbi:hypothetical protein SLH46_20360 [Draconibacterium sp. IB214405]|uniref:hypothetical protein n=1 Tax=Draconibacterium sp. IB214405 TaxID=3097352 RepID=UPI002A0CAF5D|nr:hypothetical protein [Draconibacterium sp. IB214405]MDX8341563.1 hypothetical protein [Draconibacterium sp. IB214405]
MVCALCQQNEANKKNTHYLTDAVIRSCLNQDGSGDREEGFYFDISTNNPYVSFNFQRGTSIEKLEQSLGREATEEEINKAKEIPYSVDYVFCTDCENIFTKIETPFIETVLPKFRAADLSGIHRIDVEENRIAKMFFYLQIWRTAICESQFGLQADTLEKLRESILNYEAIGNDDIPIFPIHITYLQTLGDAKSFTENIVGCTNDRNPNIIFFNDFVIQFFENEDSVKELEFYGLNESHDLNELINTNNEVCKIKIVGDDKRKEFLEAVHYEETAQKRMFQFTRLLITKWLFIFRGLPNQHIVQEYMEYLTQGNFNILKYTEKAIHEKTDAFIQAKLT